MGKLIGIVYIMITLAGLSYVTYVQYERHEKQRVETQKMIDAVVSILEGITQKDKCLMVGSTPLPIDWIHIDGEILPIRFICISPVSDV